MPVVLAFLFFFTNAEATGLVNRFQYLTSETIPDEVWTVGVSHGESLGKGDSSFDKNGLPVSNQNYFSRDISYSNLLDEINDPLERELADAAFDAYGVDDRSDAGRVVNDVDVKQKSDVYILGRGIGKKQSLMLIIPVITLETSFKSQFQNDPSLNALASQLMAEGQYQRAQEILEKSRNALSKRLDENGYRTSYPKKITTLANLHLAHRWKAWEKKKLRFTTDSTLVIPAGERSNENDLIYLRINEEQYSYRQGLIFSSSVGQKADVLLSTYYHKRFGFEKARRIPVNSVSPMSQDVDRNTRMRYGDTFGSGLQMNYHPKDNLILYLGQSFEFKNRDEVSGNKYSSSRYDFLEKDTAQELAISYLGFATNTIQSFLKGNFPIPVELNLQYSLTQAGRNTFNNQAVTMNLLVFYK